MRINILLIAPLIIGPPIKAWWIAAYSAPLRAPLRAIYIYIAIYNIFALL
jgi:hypothetical protein